MSKKSRYLKLAKREAEDILEDEVRHKAFWFVDDDYNNYEKLQDVIDVLFNSIEGNSYKVSYQDNQNGTRLHIQCLICSKDLTSYDPFITHENGKNHKKIRQQQLNPQNPNLVPKLEKRLHNEPRGIFPEGSLEEKIDNTKLLVLGVQFVYKEVVMGTERFTCHLCSLNQTSANGIFAHLTHTGHTSHNSKYLEIKYGFFKNSRAEMEQYGRHVEEREGKIHTHIIDFTKQLPPNLKEEPKSSDSGSRGSQSPSCISDQSHSPSPWEQKPPLLPLPPALPLTAESGANPVDLSECPKPIMQEVATLDELECREMVKEDEDMQGLLIQTLWILNQKMHKYYQRTSLVGYFYDKNQKRSITQRLDQCSRKVQDYITHLDIIKEEKGNSEVQ